MEKPNVVAPMPGRSAIILAGGVSARFGEDKGLVKLAGKPLLRHALNRARLVVDETIIVTSSAERVDKYRKLVPTDTRFVIDKVKSGGPLVGVLTGFEATRSKYAVVLAFDTPFLSEEVIDLLFELCIGRSAAIPRWPNGQIEPLHAVYCVNAAREAAEKAVAEGRLDMRGMIERMRAVRYISTCVIAELDAELRTFFNINFPLDLKKAESMIKSFQ